MFTEHLKSCTKPAHQQLEKLLISHIRGIDSLGRYADLLKTFYGFYQPLEQLAERWIPSSVLPDLPGRRKASWLLHDIRVLEPLSDPLPVCDQLPLMQTSSEALGALYVLEGSTLGGEIIAGMITRKLEGISREAMHFFLGYGVETPGKWMEFKKALNTYASNDSRAAAVVAGANETFRHFEQWIHHYSFVYNGK